MCGHASSPFGGVRREAVSLPYARKHRFCSCHCHGMRAQRRHCHCHPRALRCSCPTGSSWVLNRKASTEHPTYCVWCDGSPTWVSPESVPSTWYSLYLQRTCDCTKSPPAPCLRKRHQGQPLFKYFFLKLQDN